jgi:hypothetical protein
MPSTTSQGLRLHHVGRRSELCPSISPLAPRRAVTGYSGRGPGTTTIRWNTGDSPWGQVFVSLDGGADSKVVITEGGGKGDVKVDWIYPDHDYEFRLYAGKGHTVLLATVTVIRKSD